MPEHPDRDYRVIPPKPQTEVDDELRFHIERRIQQYIATGMSPDDARRAAYERFGDVNDVRHECEQILVEERRAESRRHWFEDLNQDLRFAVRSAVRAPQFSLLAIATLALGVGANAAVFGVVKSVLLNPLPYRDAGQLVRIYSPFKNGTEPRGSLSAGTISDLRERQHSFASTAAFLQPARDVVYSGETPRVVKAMWVEPAFFRTLGVSLARGGGFRDDDGLHDTTTVVIVSDAARQRLFGDDPHVLGRTIRINDIARTIVGVLPHDFVCPSGDPDFYLPLGMPLFMRNPITVRGQHTFGLVARLKPGVAGATAQREMTSIGEVIERLYAKDNLGIGLTSVPLRDDMTGDTRTPLLILLGSAALVLLIMCANLAGALLSRTISRRKEIAVRVALGAGGGRLVRQLLTESVLLALLGGLAGLALAMLALRVLRGLALPALPSYAELSLDVPAVLVMLGVSMLVGLAFGAGPALSVGRSDPQDTLREQTLGMSESSRTRRARGVLVAGQIALCVSLLAAAGLLARSLWALTTAPAGFRADGLLTFNVHLPSSRWSTTEQALAFYDDFLSRLKALPGVEDAAVASELPNGKVGNNNSLFIRGEPWAPDQPVPFILTEIVSDDYFHTLGVPLVSGRAFTSADRLGVGPVMVINQAMVDRYWPRGGAVGAQVHIGPPNPTAPWITIVGVVGNVRNDPASLHAEPAMYLSNRQEISGGDFIVRTRRDPLAVAPAVRRTLASLDGSLPITNIATMTAVIGDRFAARRLPVVLMTGFGALALLLACVGVYSMFANMAAAREREFGVRIALGSTRGSIAALVLRQGGLWMALGLAVGAVGIIAAARLLRTQLFGVPQFDPLAIGATVLVLVICAGVALLGPVSRASRVDPITVLR